MRRERRTPSPAAVQRQACETQPEQPIAPGAGTAAGARPKDRVEDWPFAYQIPARFTRTKSSPKSIRERFMPARSVSRATEPITYSGPTSRFDKRRPSNGIVTNVLGNDS